MARKSKRQSRRSRSSRQTSVAKASASRSYSNEFSPDYSQTVKDLRRIGALASTFIVVLVILSFFLR